MMERRWMKEITYESYYQSPKIYITKKLYSDYNENNKQFLPTAADELWTFLHDWVQRVTGNRTIPQFMKAMNIPMDTEIQNALHSKQRAVLPSERVLIIIYGAYLVYDEKQVYDFGTGPHN